MEVEVDIDGYFGCLKEASKSVRVLLNGIEIVTVLTLKSLTSRIPDYGCCHELVVRFVAVPVIRALAADFLKPLHECQTKPGEDLGEGRDGTWISCHVLASM